MARKSKAQIEAEFREKQAEINTRAEERATELFTGFMAKFMEQMGGARLTAGVAAAPADGESDRKLAASLAHAMIEASATPAKRAALITPEQRAEREIARKEMIDLIIANNAKGIVPVYRVTQKTFLAETLVDPQFRDPQTKQMVNQEINWRGIPNQAMAPVDEHAKVVHEAYLRSIGRNAGINQNTPSQWVTSGKELLRAGPVPASSPIPGQAPGGDPRRLGAMQGATTIRLLGSTAEPAVVTP